MKKLFLLLAPGFLVLLAATPPAVSAPEVPTVVEIPLRVKNLWKGAWFSENVNKCSLTHKKCSHHINVMC